MATNNIHPELGPGIHSLLSALRWRIRAYVWIEGLALALVWVGVTFWVGLALDYLPVLLGAREMPWTARLILLVIIGGILAFVLYRWILCRAFVQLANRSMALLLEKQFPEFRDSLLTAVEMDEHPDHAEQFNQQMLAKTGQHARNHIGQVRLRCVFNFFPLLRNVAGALVMVATLAGFGYFATEALARAVSRLVLLSDDPWPRQAHIKVDGFYHRRVKVARGSDFRVTVFADSRRHVPDVCTIHYRSENGSRGRVHMSKSGPPRGENQAYIYDGKPFKGIDSSLQFDVVGFDHRIRDFQVEVVDSPKLVSVMLDCTFPPYLVDESLSVYLPRTIPLTAGTQLPRGSQIKVRARANKDLESIEIVDTETKTDRPVTLEDSVNEPREFEFVVDHLDRTLTLEVTLHDTDRVSSDQPFRILIAAITDSAPTVDVVLRGTGTAITPDARLPFEGEISDDNAVARAWFELDVQDVLPHTCPLVLAPGGKQQGVLDLRQQRSVNPGRIQEPDHSGPSSGRTPLVLKPGDKLTLAIKAEDRHDLDGGPNVGSSDRYQLDVVTADELLALLEARELGLRRRFEQMIEEMTETRDTLIRIKSMSAASGRPDTGTEPEDVITEPEQGGGKNPPVAPQRTSLRMLTVQRAHQHVQRSAQEVRGVAVSFEDIREELINNRVDTQQRKDRLKLQIADPLKTIVQTLYADLEKELMTLQARLADPEADPEAAIAKADEILVELDKVLQKMIDLETFNELVDIVRSLIKDQEHLIEDAKSQHKRQALDLLK